LDRLAIHNSMSVVKLSSPVTREFWEIPVLYSDEHLLALDKPAGLLTSPDRNDPERPNLMELMHAGIAAGKPWASEHKLTYLSSAHRLDRETSGLILLAKSKPVLVALADLFGAEKAVQRYIALVHGSPAEDHFETNARLAPHPSNVGMVRVDPREGKKSRTIFEVIERFTGYALLRCQPITTRAHQIRVHLQNSGLKIVGDEIYGGKPLWLSRLKKDYRLKPGREERPLISRVALHAESLTLPHPITSRVITITAPWPKDLRVAVKYLRQYAQG
jgi:RluA family pseudouridine synthase